VVQFKDDVVPSDITLTQVNDPSTGWTALKIGIAGTTDSMTIGGFFHNDDPTGSANPVKSFQFANGTTWNLTQIEQALYSGTSGGDSMRGTVGNDTMSGGAGNDTIVGAGGTDSMSGGDGNDTITGGGGNDTLDGGAGNDWLDGREGTNVYRFGRGDGQDYVTFYGSYYSANGVVQFKNDVAPSDITLTKVNDPSTGWTALKVGIAGTTDSMTIGGFFYNNDPTSSVNPVKGFQFADGSSWDLGEIENVLASGGSLAPQSSPSSVQTGSQAQLDLSVHGLVQAMSVFSAQAASGDTSFGTPQAASMQVVLVAHAG
jgi:trimeric autotransporter adhesin